jgi:hypothetical protein
MVDIELEIHHLAGDTEPVEMVQNAGAVSIA